ncbi:MAG: alpha/beta hydrolase, partial [Lachnospiraceae bacterium]|nr:alpha/beta hydrolase [Lachnospiraceae bacterium]
FIDTTEKSYTEKRLKKYRLIYPLLSKIGKPKDFSRFIIQANACISHNAYGEIEKIKCPTLVIGVDNDKVLGLSSEEITEKIENSKLIIYEGFGHGVYEEAKDFNRRVLDFLSL